MDKLRAMQAFIHIAKEGSLTAAAQVMSSSLPAMVRTLAALEADLGVRLFNRTTRRISLTEEGRRHLQSCKLLLSNLEDAEAALTKEAGEPAGHLTITAPMLFGQMHVAPAVTRFVQHYTQMRCSVMLVDRVVNLLEEGIDVGIRIGPLEDSTLVAQPRGQHTPGGGGQPRAFAPARHTAAPQRTPKSQLRLRDRPYPGLGAVQ
jgi:DNA-binding transcriptional LysR family regulator